MAIADWPHLCCVAWRERGGVAPPSVAFCDRPRFRAFFPLFCGSSGLLGLAW